jgi:hypothetical protein
MPGIPAGNLRTLIAKLHDLHLRAGHPGVRTIAKGTGYSHTAVYDLFTKVHRQVPNRELLLAVAESLAHRGRNLSVEETLDRFDIMWREAASDPYESRAGLADSGREPTSAARSEGARPELTRQGAAPGPRHS